MQVTYQLTQQDFVDSFVAFRSRSVLRKWAWRLVLFVLSALTSMGLITLAFQHDSQTFLVFLPIFILAALWLLMWWGGPRLGARVQFSKQPSVQGVKTTTLDEKGISWTWDGGSAQVDWRNFYRWQECRTQFLLYTSPVLFNMIPKRGPHPRASM